MNNFLLMSFPFLLVCSWIIFLEVKMLGQRVNEHVLWKNIAKFLFIGT